MLTSNIHYIYILHYTIHFFIHLSLFFTFKILYIRGIKPILICNYEYRFHLLKSKLEIADNETDLLELETLLDRVFERCLLSAISVLRYPTSLLVKSSASSAVSGIEDRKHVLLKQLRAVFYSDSDVESGFAQALRKRVQLLLREKENLAPANIEQTLIQQAATEANLASHSTFNKSVSALITSKLTSILASLLSFTDTNHNLSVFLDENSEFRDMWLDMLSHDEVTTFGFDEALRLQGHAVVDQLSPESQLEVDVLFLPRGLLRDPRLPFSFVVFSQIDTRMCKTIDNESVVKRAVSLCRNFANTPIGEFIQQCGVNEGALVGAYLSDMVAMIHEASSQDELNAVEYVLRTQLRSIHTEVEQYITTNPEDLPEEQRMLLSLPTLHLAYEQLSNRFDLVRRLFLTSNKVGCSNEVAGFLLGVNNSQELLVNFDLLCARRLLESLSRLGKAMTEKKVGFELTGSEWAEHVKHAELIVYACFSALGGNDLTEQRSNEIGNCRHLLSRLLVVSLFLQNMKGCELDEKLLDTIWKVCYRVISRKKQIIELIYILHFTNILVHNPTYSYIIV